MNAIDDIESKVDEIDCIVGNLEYILWRLLQERDHIREAMTVMETRFEYLTNTIDYLRQLAKDACESISFAKDAITELEEGKSNED